MKGCSSRGAATSYTTCTPTRGVVNRSSRSTGRCDLKNERANSFSPASTARSSLTRRYATLSVPTPDHYLPLLYVIAQMREGEQVSFPVEGFDGGSVSMLSVQVG